MLSRITAVSAVIIAIVGWAFAVYQLVTDRWVDATGLLMVAAGGATIGASFVVFAAIKPRLGIVVAGLLLAAVSASVFAYPLTALALLLLAAHIGQAAFQRRRDARPA